MDTRETELKNALTALFNAIYSDKELGKVYSQWCDSGAYPVDVEMITRQLPDNLRQAMMTAYSILHK